MANANVQPLALMHNNEIVYIENNDQIIERKFSCFKIFKLKGPVDINYLINIIFPPSEKDYYDLEVSEYNGQSANVKFYFVNRTHKDLINHLQKAAAKFFDLSENGLVDWLASDTITFKTIYQNIDMAALQQQYRNASADNYSDTSTSTSTSISTSTSSSSISSSVTSVSAPPSSSAPSPEVRLQIFPIIDEEAIEQELQELSKKISVKTFLTSYDLERIFHNTFNRRDMTITIQDLYNEFFSQIRSVVCFMGEPLNSVKTIEDSLTLEPDTMIHTFARFLFKYTENYVNAEIIGGFVKDYKFGIVLTLWNLINAFHSIQVSYQVLLQTDNGFKQILQSHKTEFINSLSIIDQILMDILVLIYDELDREKYERLQRRLINFTKGAEELMNLVMIINNECNQQLEKLENQEKGLTAKLWTVAVAIGVSAVVIGGSLYFKKSGFRRYEKLIISTLTGTTGVAMIAGYSAKITLQNAIKQQTSVLDQLRLTHSKLDDWKKLGYEYIKHDINDMNSNRMTLIEKFVRVRLQCKCLGESFDQI